MVTKAYHPKNFDEALKICSQESVIPMAGGTDLMVQKRSWAGLAAELSKPAMFIGHLEKLQKIDNSDECIKIGSCSILSDLLEKSEVPEILKQAIAEIASPAIRNIGTIGGNICNASPAGDTLPILYVLNAELKLQTAKSSKKMLLKDFISGPGKKNLEDNEILSEIMLPVEDFDFSFYRKVGTRNANALSKLSFVGLAKKTGDVFSDFRFAFGAVGPTVVRAEEIEKSMIGKTKTEIESNLPAIIEKYSEVIKPIDDQRSDALYRKETCLRLLSHFLTDVIK